MRFFKITANVPAIGTVANYGTDYFLLKIKFLAKCKHKFTTKFAILPMPVSDWLCYFESGFINRKRTNKLRIVLTAIK